MEGYAPPPGQELQADIRIASTDYFRTMEIPLRTGRSSARMIDSKRAGSHIEKNARSDFGQTVARSENTCGLTRRSR